MLSCAVRRSSSKLNSLLLSKQFSLREGLRSLHIKINSKVYEANENMTILDACRQNHIDLPSICCPEHLSSSGKCGMCKVEVVGVKELLPSCKTKVTEGMEVWTKTPRVQANQYQCIKKTYENVVDKSVFERTEMSTLLRSQIEQNDAISINYLKCIGCNRCVSACNAVQTTSVFCESTDALPIAYSNSMNLEASRNCLQCGQCTAACPTAALQTVSHVPRVLQAVQNHKVLLVQIDPSIQTLLSDYHYDRMEDLLQEMNEVGVRGVFNTQVGYDLYLHQVSQEFYNKFTGKQSYPQQEGKKPFPLITSNCPSATMLIQQNYPALIPFLSTTTSPTEMMSTLLRKDWCLKNHLSEEEVYIVTLTNCTSLKNAHARTATDAVLSLAEWKELKSALQQSASTKPSSIPFENSYSTFSSASATAITSGGLLEGILKETMVLCKNDKIPAVIDACQNITTSKMFVQKITDNDKTYKLRCVSVNSKYVQPLLDKVMKGKVQYDLIEVYACPQGCINGGGCGSIAAPEVTQKRKESLQSMAASSPLPLPSQNPLLQTINAISFTPSQFYHEIQQETDQLIQYLQQCQTQKRIDPSQLNKNILILYGTQGGTSLEAAKQIQSQLKENNVPSEIRSMEHVQAKDLLKESRVILVCCTYGQGEFPPSAKSFWASLNDSSIVKNNRYLSHLEFAVFGLGSTQYKKFNEAGRLLDEQLSSLGGKRLLERGMVDMTQPGKYNEELESWFPSYMKSIHKEVALFKEVDPLYSIAEGFQDKYLRLQPPSSFTYVPLTKVTTETAPGYDREIRLFHFNLEGSGLHYKTGDHAAIYPRNEADLVHKVLEQREVDPTKQIMIQPKHSSTVMNWPDTITIQELFEQYVDMNAAVSKQFLKQLYPYLDHPNEKKRVHDLVMNKELFTSYSQSTTIGECLLSLPSLHMPLASLLSILPLIQPRLYSIASSSRMYPQDLQLAVGLNVFTTPSSTNPQETRQRRGLTTGYLWSLDPATKPKVAMSIHKGLLYLPDDPLTPTLFMSLGTGVAPFRAFLQEREQLHKEGQALGPCTYYYGCRYEKKDFVFGDYIKSLVEKGIIDHLQCAFSRPNHYHIDQVMRENPEIAYEAIQHKNVQSYYCGIARNVPENIMSALVSIYKEKSKASEEEKLKKQQELEENYHLECF